MRVSKKVKVLFITFCCALGLAACGGGGGDGVDTPAPSSYTGAQTEATLESNNAEAIVLGAYEGVEYGSGVPMMMAVTQGSGTSRPLALASAMETVVRNMDLTPQVRMAATETFTEPGNCGGDVTFHMNVNESTGAFSGSMNLTSYCSDGMTMNGQVSFSGSINESTQTFALSMTFNSLSTTVDGETATISGSMSMAISFDSSVASTFSMKLVLTDADDRTFYVDYTISATERVDYEEVLLTGRFYSFDHGYVNISTVTPIRIGASDYPYYGVMKFTGANNTWATLNFLGGGAYRIDLHDETVITGTL